MCRNCSPCPRLCSLTLRDSVQVPGGTQPGDYVRMRGFGIKKLNSGFIGDHYIHLNIEIPKCVVAASIFFL